MCHTFSHTTFLGYNNAHSRLCFSQLTAIRTHIIRWHMCPWRRLLPGYDTRFFLQRGCCCQGKEVVPVDHIRGKGLSSRLRGHLKSSHIADKRKNFHMALYPLPPSSNESVIDNGRNVWQMALRCIVQDYVNNRLSRLTKPNAFTKRS